MRNNWLEKEILNFVSAVFDHDLPKIVAWFQTSNPLFGNQTPVEMIKSGRVEKLHKFLTTQVSENYPTCE